MKFGQWLGLAVLVVSLYVLWQVRQLVLLLFTAVLLATTLNKLAKKIQARLSISRGMSAAAAAIVFVSSLVGIFLIVIPPFIKQFRELTSTKLPEVIQFLDRSRTNLAQYLPPAVVDSIPSSAELTEQLKPLGQQLLGGSIALFSNSLGIVLNIIFLLILTFMLLAQPSAYRNAFVLLFPHFYRRRIDYILTACEVSLGKWIAGALLSMIVVGVLSAIGLLSLGIPLVIAQAVLAGLLNFIPNLGPTLSVILPMAIALLDAPWKSAAIFFIYFLIQQFESNLLTPYIMAQQVSLLPAITLAAQLFFASAFGFLGLLLAIPLTVVGKVFIDEILIKDILNRWRKKVIPPTGKNPQDAVYEPPFIPLDDRGNFADPWGNPDLLKTETEFTVTSERISIDENAPATDSPGDS